MFAIFVFYAQSMSRYKFSIPNGIVQFVVRVGSLHLNASGSWDERAVWSAERLVEFDGPTITSENEKKKLQPLKKNQI